MKTTNNDYIKNKDFILKTCFLEKEKKIDVLETAEIERNNMIKKYCEQSNKKEFEKDCYIMVAKFLLNHAEMKLNLALATDLKTENYAWLLYNEAGNEFINVADYYLMADDKVNAAYFYKQAADSIMEGSKSCEFIYQKYALERKADKYYEKAKTILLN
ncbi:MAG: hypothetical protein JXB50_09325 [Spirochaetes bacterium]|nr:hypothetical protein [Spirochaetota bacterium]